MRNINQHKINKPITPAICKWRRSGNDRRYINLGSDMNKNNKRSVKDRRIDWLDIASKVIYPPYDTH